MRDDMTATELTVTRRQAYGRHRGVGISMPSLPAWMPAALGVREVVELNFAPARQAAEIRTELGGSWRPLNELQQLVLARWVQRAVEAVHAVTEEGAHG